LGSTLSIFQQSITARFEIWVKGAVIALLRFFHPQSPLTRVELSGVKSILVVRQHDQLGDMLCVVPLLRAMRMHFPDAHITLVAGPVNYHIMQHHPYVNEVLHYEKLGLITSPRTFLRFHRALKSRRYDLAVVPTTVSISLTSNLIAFVSGAKLRVGADMLNGMPSSTSFLFSVTTRLGSDEDRNRHQTLRNLDILKPLGFTTDNLETLIGVTDEEKSEADRFLSSLRSEHKILIGLHPGAGKLPNRWPAQRFAEAANQLCEKFSAAAVITAGPVDDDPINSMVRHIRCRFVLVRGRPIRAVAAIIGQLNLFITNDTGIMHVAAASGAPTLSIFGPTNPLQWAPKGGRNRYVLAKGGDINSVPVQEVVETAGAMLTLKV